MKQRLFSLFAALSLCGVTLAFSGCGEQTVSAEDFSLTLECVFMENSVQAEDQEDNILYIRSQGTLTATFENRSGRRLSVLYSGGENFSGFLHIYVYEEGKEPDTTNVSNAVEASMKKSLRLTEERNFMTLRGESRRAFASVSFTCKGQQITLQSQILSL